MVNSEGFRNIFHKYEFLNFEKFWWENSQKSRIPGVRSPKKRNWEGEHLKNKNMRKFWGAELPKSLTILVRNSPLD